MQLIDSILYDPSTAASNVTDAASAMAALDTTNLRISFVAPVSGKVHVILRGTLHGSTTNPVVLLGVLSGTTVVARQLGFRSLGTTSSANSQITVQAEFTVDVTPGASLVWDAAYATQVAIASTAIKYGGPDTASGNDAFGGFLFEVWDAKPAGRLPHDWQLGGNY